MSDAIELVAGDYEAVIDRRGAALRRLAFAGRDLVWRYSAAERPRAFQGQVLAPWPNRVGDGRYTFAGAEHQLEVTEPERGTAIHGLVHAEPWLPAEITPVLTELRCAVDGAPGYPFRLELTVAYALDPVTGLAVTISARNTGASPAPYGAGAHPYLTVGAPLDAATLRLPARRFLPVNERNLPTGDPEPVDGTGRDFRAPRRIDGEVLDTAFTGLDRDENGQAWSVLSGPDTAVALWVDPGFGWLQVFSGDTLPEGVRRQHLAVEPMTCPPDAFRTGTDLRVLSPGESTEARFGIRHGDPLG